VTADIATRTRTRFGPQLCVVNLQIFRGFGQWRFYVLFGPQTWRTGLPAVRESAKPRPDIGKHGTIYFHDRPSAQRERAGYS